MASIHINTIPSGKINIFEETATHFLPCVPVAKKITSKNQGSSEISDTSKVEISSFGTKASIGKTGVLIRYHKIPYYATLSIYQKEGLREWHSRTLMERAAQKGGTTSAQIETILLLLPWTKQVEKTLSEAIKSAVV